jgi:hypothetical protein
MSTEPTKASLFWEGPKTYESACDLKQAKDFGLYMFVGRHPAFGLEMPLYLGKAEKRHLGTRIAEHRDWFRHESMQLKVYTGRFISTDFDQILKQKEEDQSKEQEKAPSDELWSSLIDRAERLLIFSGSFPYNSSSVKWMDFKSDELTVMNLGERHMLPMMVSTLYWKEYYELNGDGENAKPESRYWVWKGE